MNLLANRVRTQKIGMKNGANIFLVQDLLKRTLLRNIPDKNSYRLNIILEFRRQIWQRMMGRRVKRLRPTILCLI